MGVGAHLTALRRLRVGRYEVSQAVSLDQLATVRGTAIRGASLDPSQVREIGLLIADKREGAFALSVDWIAVE